MRYDGDCEMNSEFAHPFKFENIDEENIRNLFTQFRVKNELYASLKINLVTAYGFY